MTITIDDIKTLKFGDKVRINPCFLPKELVRNSIFEVPFMGWFQDTNFNVLINVAPYGFDPANLLEVCFVSLDKAELTKFFGKKCGRWVTLPYVESIPSKMALVTIRAQNATTNCDGCNCALCKKYCQYAEPNLPDGRFVCYSCKSTKAWML